MRSNSWRNKIDVKRHLSEETSNEKIKSLCIIIHRKLKKILDKETKRTDLRDDYKDLILCKINEVLDHFDFCKDLCDMSEENRRKEYDITDSLLTVFNDYMSELYDLGDERVLTKSNVLEKFMWVE